MNPSEQTQNSAPPEAVDQSTVQAAENVVNNEGMGEVSVSPQNIDTSQPAPAPEAPPQPQMIEVPDSIAPAAAPEAPSAPAAPVAGENVPLTSEQVASIEDPSKVMGINQDGINQWNEAREAVDAAPQPTPVATELPAPTEQVPAPPVVADQPVPAPAPEAPSSVVPPMPPSVPPAV